MAGVRVSAFLLVSLILALFTQRGISDAGANSGPSAALTTATSAGAVPAAKDAPKAALVQERMGQTCSPQVLEFPRTFPRGRLEIQRMPSGAVLNMDWKRLSKIDLRYVQGIHCKGSPCPKMTSCTSQINDTSITKILACSYDDLVDEDTDFFPMHYDRQRPNTVTPQVLTLYDVFITGLGVVFDHKHIYEFPGDCLAESGTDIEMLEKKFPNVTLITSIGDAITSLHMWGNNYYHNLVEVTGALFLLLPFLHLKPFQEVLHRGRLANFELLGVNPDDLDLYMCDGRQVYFVHKLVVPTPMPCERPSSSVIARIRRDLFRFHPLPIGNSSHLSDARKDMSSIPSDWSIIFGVRHHTRYIIGWEDLLVRLSAVVPKNRIEIFTGHVTLSETQELFAKARLYMAVHGAGLANIIFLPPWGEVMEVVSKDVDSHLYRWLTRACSLPYTRFYGNGTKGTNFTVDHDAFVAKVTEIAKGFPITAS
eukprot:TRINITY_DN7875_c0_g2_i1.p1 TRINITY_DN7875_c0_g2~~TRINITY_DN7875_c0_g2_i1.p1  ORF type:complete len:516 (+),score=33.78 TRINITY_DN7875_c0_g2_i1:109-1548(+)